MKSNKRAIILFLVLLISFVNYSCDFLIHRIHNPRPKADNLYYANHSDSKVSGKLQFIVIGDWGEKGEFFQKEVARAMQKIESEEEIDFVLTTGDNFYPNGVKGINDEHFIKSFESIYKFSKPLTWYIAVGNHDYMGDIQSQIDYGAKNKNWILPYTYYSFDKKLSTKETVSFFITDTNEFIDIMGFLTYRFYIREDKGQTQLTWLKENLHSSNSKWKIVVGHHPIYSAGDHGDTKFLQKEFLETLEKNNIDLYISGHEHDLQHLKHPDKKIQFVISGAGSKIRQIKSSPYSLFFASEPGFAVININQIRIEIRFINQDAKEIYKTVIEK